MSATWKRAETAKLCGYDPQHVIAVGAPYLELSKVWDVKRVLIRCALCAGPAPPDLPPLVARQTTKRMTPLSKAAKGFTVPK